ncbi:MAG: diacylglycerol/lipid kinase family protein [Janthinobacterium lividum]
MTETPRWAVVANPTKLSDGDAALVRERLAAAGHDPLWLETTADDPGRVMTRQALDADVELVLAAGGDGTIRMVAQVLAGTDVAMGILPVGTGNLLARNLFIPLDVPGALDVVLGEAERRIDTVVLTVDGGEPERFAVMAGTGLDAMIMDNVNDTLKKFIGPGAYFIAATKAIGHLPVPVHVTIDGKRHRRNAVVCLLASCGQLPGDLALVPDARPDDGLVHVYVAFPSRLSHWFKALLRLVTRRPRKDDHVRIWTGRRVEIRLGEKDPYQLDGDVGGEGTVFSAEVDPGSLRIRAAAPHRADAAPPNSR